MNSFLKAGMNLLVVNLNFFRCLVCYKNPIICKNQKITQRDIFLGKKKDRDMQTMKKVKK